MIEVVVGPEELTVDRPTDLEVVLVNRGEVPCLQISFRLELPETFLLLKGSARLEHPRLEPGASVRLPLEVRGRRVGEWSLGSRGFSFWDACGQLHRVEGFRRTLRVIPAPEGKLETLPRLKLELLTEELALGCWSLARCRVSHQGGAGLERLAVRAIGRVECDPEQPWVELKPPPPGGREELELVLRGCEPGHAVPIRLEARFLDLYGRTGAAAERGAVRVAPTTVRATESPGGEPAKPERVILLVSANPTGNLRVAREARDMRVELRSAKERDRFCLVHCEAAEPQDLTRAMVEHRPAIVHFSGHGSQRGALYFESENGDAPEVSAGVLNDLFQSVEGTVDCVLLNACFSAVQARAIVRWVPFVIGMRQEIDDESARKFTVGFYKALGAGCGIDEAFRWGCLEIGVTGGRGSAIPVLLSKDQPLGDVGETATPCDAGDLQTENQLPTEGGGS